MKKRGKGAYMISAVAEMLSRDAGVSEAGPQHAPNFARDEVQAGARRRNPEQSEGS